jgi:type I restriction enzyme R subunit
MAMITPERDLEESLVTKLRDLKYEYRPDIRDRATLEANFREKFEALNRVTLTDGEFQRLLDEIVTPDVYLAALSLRNREAFVRDDGTPLNYTLVNIKDWCKNTFEVVNQLRINTDNSHHRYDVNSDQRRPRRSDRVEDAWDQPPAGDGADRRVHEGTG